MFSWCPTFYGRIGHGYPNDLPVYIEADQARLNQSVSASYEGNVEIQQGNRQLRAQRADISQQNSPMDYSV